MPPKRKSNKSQRSTHIDLEESKAQRDSQSDAQLNDSIKTGTRPLFHLSYKILIFSLSNSNHDLNLDSRDIPSISKATCLVLIHEQ